MANPEHLKILEQGVVVWNTWRELNPGITPDLSESYLWGRPFDYINLSNANLSSINLSGAKLRNADFREASLGEANLIGTRLSNSNFQRADLINARLAGADLRATNLTYANLSGADLSGADLTIAQLTWAELIGADLSRTELSYADLREADLIGANLTQAKLRCANLVFADLTQAIFNRTNLKEANLSNCRVHGIAAWNLNLVNATQTNLVITDLNEPEVTVDNLEVAQFIYLLLHNQKIRAVIDTITTKAVLILGRFTNERKSILDAIRDELRKQGYIPILFDFEKPTSRGLTETIITLAGISRFVIADITDAKSIPQELQIIVPNLPSVAVQPIIQADNYEYAMFEHFKHYAWVLPLFMYADKSQLIDSLSAKVIEPAEAKVEEMRPKKL